MILVISRWLMIERQHSKFTNTIKYIYDEKHIIYLSKKLFQLINVSSLLNTKLETILLD